MKHIIIVLLFSSPFIGLSQESTPFQQDIKNLMILTGTDKLSLQMMDQMLTQFSSVFPDVPSEVWDEFRNEVNMDEFMQLIIPVYEKYFTHDDIEVLIEFYKTPVGKKTIAVMPSVMQESMQIGQEWGLQISERVRVKLEEKGYFDD